MRQFFVLFCFVFDNIFEWGVETKISGEGARALEGNGGDGLSVCVLG